ncbi:MAG: acyl-CoA dehydrogenase family protein [Hydrogenophaga sp.]|uniref:acyl-CoA dehydrogenase family protein n=1 Tax=Hydrogenophaga sp. TaxID=1904254 RepID=UPI003D0A9172
MNFELHEDQVQLRDSLSRLLADQYAFEQRRAIAASAEGTSPAVWRQICGLGLSGLRIAEEHGGFGGSAADLSVVMQAFGKALLTEPFLASAVLGATALSLSGDATSHALLPQVASGERIVAWACDEAAGRHAPCWVETRAIREGSSWRLTGAKACVLNAPQADVFLVSARVSGSSSDGQGVALFLVQAGSEGLNRRAYRLIDDTPAGDLRLDGVLAVPLGDPADPLRGAQVIEATRSAGVAAVCADAVGAMEGAYQLTVEYLNTRKQFGRFIGENQSLRHRVAEMMVELEVARSMAFLAACAIDDPGSVQAEDLARAKYIIGLHGRSLCQSAIQLHGGIGMTEEYAVGHYLRRIAVIDQLFGDSAAQLSRLTEMLDTTT